MVRFSRWEYRRTVVISTHQGYRRLAPFNPTEQPPDRVVLPARHSRVGHLVAHAEHCSQQQQQWRQRTCMGTEYSSRMATTHLLRSRTVPLYLTLWRNNWLHFCLKWQYFEMTVSTLLKFEHLMFRIIYPIPNMYANSKISRFSALSYN